MNAFEPKVKGTSQRPETDLPETGNPQSQSPNPQSENPQSAIPESQSAIIHSKKRPRAAIPVIAILILALAAGIGGLFYDQAAPTKPSDGMADNPAVRDFAKAIEVIEDNNALTPDKERRNCGAILAGCWISRSGWPRCFCRRGLRSSRCAGARGVRPKSTVRRIKIRKPCLW